MINRKLQLLQVMILKDIARICDENHLRYYLIGGTLLGAVRHKGFIPWDDDIDLVMYREDYNRLIEIMRRDHAEKYFIQNYYTDPTYTRYITKVRLNGTVLIEENLQKSNANCGVYVDIFPLDRVKKTHGFGLWLRGKIVRILFAYKTIRYDAQSRRSATKKMIGKCLRWITWLFPDKLMNRLFDYVCQKDNHKNCSYTTNFASHFKWKKQLIENEAYGEGCKLEFEGCLFTAPCGYEKILKNLYGSNYMQLPPEEKRISHSIVKLDLGPYEQVLERDNELV